MTEMLEPAPMLDDGDEYGGPMKQSDANGYDINNNDDAESDIQLDIKDSDSDNNSESSTLNIHHNQTVKEIDAMTPKTNINSFSDEKKLEDEPLSYGSHDSNKALMNNNPLISEKSDHRATSAGFLLGEKNDQQQHRVHTLSHDIMIHDKKQYNVQYRPSRRSCCSDCYARLYSYPRLRIFLSFLYLLLSLILCYGDIFGALWVGNEIWTFKKPSAHTDHHELWFGILMVLIIAPYLILWAAHLIFIEEKLSAENVRCKMMKYPIMFLYLITPIGIIFLIIYEFFYIYLWTMINLLFYRFLCAKPSYKMIMNIKKTKGSGAYLRFRKITHLLSSSVPLMLFYGYLYYFDPYPRLRWKYLAATTLISMLNCMFTICTFYSDAKSINIALTQYFILSFRLFGGFIPKLSQIKNGGIQRINYSSFAFGNYSYASFADVISSPSSVLHTIILTQSTLSHLSHSLCYQLGAVCSRKHIEIIILKNYSPYVVWFKHLFPKHFVYKVSLKQLAQAFRRCDIFGDKSEEEFAQLQHDLHQLYDLDNENLNIDNIYYYYRDFVSDWNGFSDENQGLNYGIFHRLLRILPPHIVDVNNKNTEKAEKKERLLSLVLGSGAINVCDPTNKTSALFYAIIQMDYDLINRLCDNGAKTSADEWQRIGEYIIQLVKDNKYDMLCKLIKLIKDRKEIECDLTYHDIDGKTAVIYCAMNGNLQICQLLLNANLGADILHMDQDGNTASDYAAKHKHSQLEQYLRDQFL